jgi:hypothetical protein
MFKNCIINNKLNQYNNSNLIPQKDYTVRDSKIGIFAEESNQVVPTCFKAGTALLPYLLS